VFKKEQNKNIKLKTATGIKHQPLKLEFALVQKIVNEKEEKIEELIENVNINDENDNDIDKDKMEDTVNKELVNGEGVKLNNSKDNKVINQESPNGNNQDIVDNNIVKDSKNLDGEKELIKTDKENDSNNSLNTVLFIKNVSFESTEQDLKNIFLR